LPKSGLIVTLVGKVSGLVGLMQMIFPLQWNGPWAPEGRPWPPSAAPQNNQNNQGRGGPNCRLTSDISM